MSLKINEFNSPKLEIREPESRYLNKDVLFLILDKIEKIGNINQISRTAATCKTFYNFFVTKCVLYRARSLLARVEPLTSCFTSSIYRPDEFIRLNPQFIRAFPNGSELYIAGPDDYAVGVPRNTIGISSFDEEKGFSVKTTLIDRSFHPMEDGQFLGVDDNGFIYIWKIDDEGQHNKISQIYYVPVNHSFNFAYHKGIYFIRCTTIYTKKALIICYSEKLKKAICITDDFYELNSSKMLSTQDGLFFTYNGNDRSYFQEFELLEKGNNVYSLVKRGEVFFLSGEYNWQFVHENLILGQTNFTFCLAELDPSKQNVKKIYEKLSSRDRTFSLHQNFLIISGTEYRVFHIPSKTDYTEKFKQLLWPHIFGYRKLFSMDFSKSDEKGIVLKAVMFLDSDPHQFLELSLFLERPSQKEIEQAKELKAFQESISQLLKHPDYEIQHVPLGAPNKVKGFRAERLTPQSPKIFIITSCALALLTLAAVILLRHTGPGAILFKISETTVGKYEFLAFGVGGTLTFIPLAIWSCKRLKARTLSDKHSAGVFQNKTLCH